MNNDNIKDYWNPSSPSYPKTRFINKPADDWEIDEDEAEYEDEDPYCDEIGHTPRAYSPKYSNCIYCGIELVKTHINGEAVWVDPKELVKLEQWNTMSTQHGQDDRLNIDVPSQDKEA